MKLAECVLESVAPYQQGKYYSIPKLARENPDDYEKRTWRERCHATPEGQLYIPPLAFANSVKEAARYLGLKVPGKGSTLYTKHFEAGVMVVEPLLLPETKDSVEGVWLFLPSDGKRGGGKRVYRCFPTIRQWSGTVLFYILDDIITEPVFRQTLDYAGNIIGIGVFRPTSQGYHGRFRVKSVTWADGN